MTQPDDEGPDEEPEASAAEYVLGLLTRAEADAFERRLDAEPRVAQAVARWNERLLGLADLPLPVPGTAALWRRIEADLEPRAAARAVPRLRAASGLEDRLWSSLAFWRLGAATGALAALVMALWTTLAPPVGPQPTVVTVLQAADGAPAWVVQAYADATLQVTPLRPVAVGVDQALELWTLRDRQEGPVSLGLLPPVAGVTGLPIGHRPPPAPGDLFEVTLEGAEGSPVGRPTGPVLGKGLATDAS